MANFEVSLDKDFDLKVGAHTIHVVFVPGDHTALSDHSNGAWFRAEYTIYISADDPESMRLSSLYHELIHVLEDFYNVKMSHRDLNLVGDIIAQIMIDNFQVASTKKKKR